MALIKCPECGKEISDKATACIQCGCPIKTSNLVKIKIQNCDWTTFMQPESVSIFSNGNLLWSGQTGQVVTLNIDSPIQVIFKIHGIANDPTFVIHPNHRYSLERVKKTSWRRNISFLLNEIDIIDSE